MDQPFSHLPKPSGLPRVSRLPLPRGSDKIVPANDPVRRTFTGRVLPAKTSQATPKGTVSTTKAAEPVEQATPKAEPESLGPSNSVDDDLKDTDAVLSIKASTQRRKPRPSLSDRTIETLSQIPPSPSPGRRKSSFFTSESPYQASSRPTSSLSRSRPNTSHGQYPPLPSSFATPRPASPTKRPLLPATGNQVPNVTPSKRAVSSYVAKSLPHRTSNARLGSNVDSTPSKSKPSEFDNSTLTRNPTEKVPKLALKQVSGSKTLAARPSKPRASVQDAISQSVPKTAGIARDSAIRGQRKVSSTLLGDSANTSSKSSPSPKRFAQTSSDSTEPETSTATQSPKSSAALRESIAKAKAARRTASKSLAASSRTSKPSTEDFPEIELGRNDAGLLRKRIASARTDGRLNIAALGLTEIPREVLNMYNIGVGDGAWYESVDLVRLIAADNEIKILKDGTFPDDNVASHSADDDYKGNLFGGLETLDFHGNHLRTLPIGLRRLERLTTLNLSKNGLHNDCLDIISQIDCLRELRLAENTLEGTLGSQLCKLKNLETLDVRNNALTALPSNLDEVTTLRALHLDGNRLASLPFECLLGLPLTELSAARNGLSRSLFPSSVHGLSRLKVLDVANNALTSLAVNGDIEFPALQSLNVTENRLAMLPDISNWTELTTLTVGGNKLSSFPEGITSLQKLKAVDFSRNDIRSVDERFGLMESLTALVIANNPLQERKFLRMDTDEMKRELRSRLLPAEFIDAGDENVVSFDESDPVAGRTTSAPRLWPIKIGGVLDRSSTNLETIERSDLEPLAAENDIKTVILQHNLLQCIPPVIAVTSLSLTSLDISDNKLSRVSYLPAFLELPKLKSLNVSANGITSFSPLLDNLSAPVLAELNVSRNRLTSLPVLRDTFPSLKSLIASNNSIAELQVDAVRGLHVLDVSGNEIGHLEPKLGLLDAEGLRTLLVGGNKFRVPRRDIIEKGTGAVLTYLKGRIPDEEMQGLG
ncbi:hypothetical protein N7G274_000644 [Stereocaulon virgatum]|uniref:L domain-like protein n=1 Tax=Stereocaulon virgatum TaxID=373712 RepID=A0ABR4APD3_9LECA